MHVCTHYIPYPMIELYLLLICFYMWCPFTPRISCNDMVIIVFSLVFSLIMEYIPYSMNLPFSHYDEIHFSLYTLNTENSSEHLGLGIF